MLPAATVGAARRSLARRRTAACTPMNMVNLPSFAASASAQTSPLRSKLGSVRRLSVLRAHTNAIGSSATALPRHLLSQQGGRALAVRGPLSAGFASAAGAGDAAMVFYKLTVDGEEVDSNIGRQPMEVKLGGGGVIPGFEAALMGMAAGDKKSVTIAPADGYGEKDPERVQQVPKDNLPEGVEVGAQLQSGQGQVVTVVEVTDEGAVSARSHCAVLVAVAHSFARR